MHDRSEVPFELVENSGAGKAPEAPKDKGAATGGAAASETSTGQAQP
jgi:hypothetical protein